MPEASSRILADRSVIRLDGRPFFTFGPRVLLTSPDRYPAVLRQIAEAGFTAVGSPPASPGTLWLLQHFFDSADKAGLMVILNADPRLPNHGRYLSEVFSHRPSLHSYQITPRPSTSDGLDAYLRERDSLRAQDLFHPIFVTLTPAHCQPSWLRSQDLYVPELPHPITSNGRVEHQQPGKILSPLIESAETLPPRPLMITDLNVFTSDEERIRGSFSDDAWVTRLSPKHLHWFPYLANLSQIPRSDLLSPVPEILRLQFYDAISNGCRGIMLDFYEAMEGPEPITGKDRFYEAAILAQEAAVFRDFFAEGVPNSLPVETGHPRLRANVLRHGLDHLIVLRLVGYEADFFVDEAFMERTEIGIPSGMEEPVSAWRVDFPEVRRLEIVKDSSGAIRFLAGPLELTGLIFLASGTRRAQDIAEAISRRLETVALLAVQRSRLSFIKVKHIEDTLRNNRTGIDNAERMAKVEEHLEEAGRLLDSHDPVGAYRKARTAGRYLRSIIKYQLAKALAIPMFDRADKRSLLRENYFTLPSFYREGARELARSFTDLT